MIYYTDECSATVQRCKQVEKDGDENVKDLQNKIKNAKAIKEQQLKDVTKHLEECKKEAEQIRTKWDTMKQVTGNINILRYTQFIQ